ncbi:MAG TPA: hypothetical protein VNZ47_17330 [Candidatus Dormibacteraeota bacterium]|nr:hypothetical protein [Candidatus Dormibacteraeota bacterium]
MSSAVAERIVEQPRKLDLVPSRPAPQALETEQWDPHPLLPVFVAIAISLVLSAMFIGSILVWLSLRHSGVMAP